MEKEGQAVNHPFVKTAMVTGASRGIGKACSLRLAKAGYNVVVNYRDDEEGANDTAGLVKENEVEALAIKADVTDVTQIAEMVSQTLKRFGRLDVLVCNAGIYDRCSFEELDEDRWDRTLATNLDGAFLCCKAALDALKENPGSSIVVITSQIGFKGSKWGAHYAASKAGLLGLLKSLALELAPMIRVNGIAPGYIDTDILSHDTKEKKEQRAKEVPMRMIGTPEDVANTVAFLVSDEARYITGETVHVNGGLLMY